MILNRSQFVSRALNQPSPLRTFLQGLSPECECALKEYLAIGQPIDPMIGSAEKWRDFLADLLPVSLFYRPIGGLVGYQLEILSLLEGRTSVQPKGVRYHSPVFDDISEPSREVREMIRWGIDSLPFLSELYPLGGAADRLHLVDESTGSDLPAARLRFVGRPLLDGLVRDLYAREWLYFRLYGKQIVTPIAMMTSREKDNHAHVLSMCEQAGWFGRPKESFRLFIQPLVPTVNESGMWHETGPLKPILKPGGHGAIWKLARDEGVFQWLMGLGRTKALVRQINNPVAGLDYGLLAFTGIGFKRNMTFGFASCPRLVQSAEGMNVLVEKENGSLVLTNIEYCDFAKFGIEDRPMSEGKPFSKFSSNTNILFVDLQEVEQAVERCPFPGLLVNAKTVERLDLDGNKKTVQMARLESTMQNLADVFPEPKKAGAPIRTEKTFVTYNRREKTISVAKKAFAPGKPLLETPERCFYELLQENRSVLSACGFQLPPMRAIEEMLAHGPESLFLYHPALGPLYSIIRQKIQGGRLAEGSELLLEIAELEVKRLHLAGSLQVIAHQPLGKADANGRLQFSECGGRCRLLNVTVENRGVDWSRSSPFWKMDLIREETARIELRGNSEFFASDVVLRGSHHFIVEDGIKMRVIQENGTLRIDQEEIKTSGLWNYAWNTEGDRVEEGPIVLSRRRG